MIAGKVFFVNFIFILSTFSRLIKVETPTNGMSGSEVKRDFEKESRGSREGIKMKDEKTRMKDEL